MMMERKHELEMEMAKGRTNGSSEARFPERKVPTFDEKAVESFFSYFETLAEGWKVQKDDWATLIHPVLTGRAREIFLSLTPADRLDYDKLRAAILEGYSRVPESYRRELRSRKKRERNFQKERTRLRVLFDQWCCSLPSILFSHLKVPVRLEHLMSILLCP